MQKHEIYYQIKIFNSFRFSISFIINGKKMHICAHTMCMEDFHLALIVLVLLDLNLQCNKLHAMVIKKKNRYSYVWFL